MRVSPRLSRSCVASILAFAVTVTSVVGRTPMPPLPNSYTPAREARLGRDAIRFITQNLEVVADPVVNGYLNGLAQRLGAGLPPELQYAEFNYAVVLVKTGDVVSIPLPGGPLVISSTIVELAPSEAALAALLAHEFSHIALRHGTAQWTSGAGYQLGELSGRVIGAAATDRNSGILDRGAQFGVQSYFLTYEAAYEEDARRLAAAIMAHCGYPPSALTAMVRALTERGAALGGPLWVLRHPSAHEDGYFEDIRTARSDADGQRSQELARVQATMPVVSPPAEPAASAREIVGTAGHSVPAPSGESRSVTAGDLLQVQVPADWSRVPDDNTVIFAPPGGYIPLDGGTTAVVTHGFQLGVARSVTGELEGDMHALLDALGQDNRSISWRPAFQEVMIGGGLGMTTTVSHVSPVTRQFEQVTVSAVHLADDTVLLYAISVAPHEEGGIYRGAFNRIVSSLRMIS